MTSPLKPLSQFCSNFIWSLLRVGERKIAKMVTVHWPRWPPRPYMVKTFKNLLLPKLLKELSYIDVWPFYGKVKFASLCICMGKTFKNLLLQNRACLMAESLHISSGSGGLPKLLKWWSYIDIWPFYGKVNFASLCICMGKMFRISYNFSSGAFGPILLKFHMEPP